MLPGPPTIYQTILDHPRRRRVRPVVAAARGHRRGGRPGRADPAHARGAQLRDDRHRLRAHRGHRHRDDVPPRRRPRDDRDDVRPGDPRTSRCSSSTTTATRSPTGEPGEVVVRGYNVMQGYFDDPEATAEAIDADGWLHTGDVGVIDERGNLRITDRMKDMFIVGGFNAYPAEIENMILRPPGGRAGRGRRRPRRAHGRGRHGVRRAARPAQTIDARRADRVVPRAAWPTTRCRATSRSSTRSRSTRPARSSSTSSAIRPSQG